MTIFCIETNCGISEVNFNGLLQFYYEVIAETGEDDDATHTDDIITFLCEYGYKTSIKN